MRRLLALLLAATAAAAAALLARRRRALSAASPPPAPMPGPTTAPVEPPPAPMAAEPAPEPEPATAPTAGPIDEGEPGAITAAPVPETEPAAKSERVETPDDATLVHEVESTIAEDPVVPEEGVKIEVEDGVAELTGTVPDETTAERAGDVAGHVDGVIGLDNKLEPGAEERRDRED
jgi:hypothetical protein